MCWGLCSSDAVAVNAKAVSVKVVDARGEGAEVVDAVEGAVFADVVTVVAAVVAVPA